MATFQNLLALRVHPVENAQEYVEPDRVIFNPALEFSLIAKCINTHSYFLYLEITFLVEEPGKQYKSTALSKVHFHLICFHVLGESSSVKSLSSGWKKESLYISRLRHFQQISMHIVYICSDNLLESPDKFVFPPS